MTPTKVFVIPSEFAEAFGGLTKSLAAAGPVEDARAGPADPGANAKGTLSAGP